MKTAVSVVGLLNRSKPTVKGAGAPGYAAEKGYGGGLLIEMPIASAGALGKNDVMQMFKNVGFDLEIGALYMKRKYKQTQASTGPAFDIGGEQKFLQFPVLFRMGLYFGLSVGFGAYYGRDLTDRTSNFNGSEFGGIASARLNLFPNSPLGIIFDARYNFAWSNATSVHETKFSGTQMIAGFRIGRR